MNSSLTTGAPVTLSRNFTLRELLRTATGLPNEPTTDRQLASLIRLCQFVLQPIRDQFGPIRITSGFRSPAVNAAIPGASSTSQHMLGEAADIIPERASTHEVFLWVAKSLPLATGQVIHERRGRATWVHVSLPRPGRARELLVYDGTGYRVWTGGALS